MFALIAPTSDFGNGFVTFAEVVWSALFVLFIAVGFCVLAFLAAHGLTILIRVFKPTFLSHRDENNYAEEATKDKQRVALVALDFILQTRLGKERDARRLRKEIEAKALGEITKAAPRIDAPQIFNEEIDLTEELAASVNSAMVEAVRPAAIVSDVNESRALYWLMCPTGGQERFVVDFLAPKAGVRGTRWAFCSVAAKYRKTFSRRDAQLWASVLRKERECLILPANIHARVSERFRSEKRGVPVTAQGVTA